MFKNWDQFGKPCEMGYLTKGEVPRDNSLVTMYCTETFSPETPDLNMRWVVLRTKPQLERLAGLHLIQREVEPYCPMFQEPQFQAKAPKPLVPMFKGYIFVKCDVMNRLNAVCYCPGVMCPVRFDGRVATVEQDVIDALRKREGRRGYAQTREREFGFDLGQSVRIMDGPLRGLEGIFFGYLRGDQRSKVLMEFLRAKKTIEVDTISLAMVAP